MDTLSNISDTNYEIPLSEADQTADIGQAEEPVRVQDLASYDGMILCNSRGWAPVSRVDDLMIPQDEAFTGVIAAAIQSCPWDEI